MRLSNRYSLMPFEGARRTRRKFLFRPRRFGYQQARWLEFATIIEEVRKVAREYDNGLCYCWKWCEVGFG